MRYEDSGFCRLVMKWGKEVKEMVQYATAVMMLLVGSALATIALWQSGWREIPDSVLWMSAQCLIYAGSIFGVSLVINYKFGQIMNIIDNQQNKNGRKDKSKSGVAEGDA